MSIRKISALVSLLVVLAVPLFAQDAKQALNDQLWEAARKGDAAEVTALLDKGADVNAKFRYGTTALFKAAERGNTEVVKVLLARGAEVNTKDTFYGATAMTWALTNDHFEVVRALLEKSSESVDEVLTTGARTKKPQLVQIALDKGGAKPATLTTALVAVTTAEEKSAEIAELLRKGGAVPPAAIDAATLQSYIGKYKSDQGREYEVSAKDGLVFITFTAGLFALVPVDSAGTFRPAAFDGVTLVFKTESGKVSSIDLKQGPTTTVLKRQ